MRMSEQNIYQRINKVREEVAYVQKDKAVQGYKAVTHDAVTSVIRPSLIKHGIVIVPRLIASAVRDTESTTGNGAKIIRYEGWYEIDFVNIDTPDEKVTIPIESHALDYGDKAPGKAISYATKYAVLKLFSIETGEDDESRLEMKPPQESKHRFKPGEAAKIQEQVRACLVDGDEHGLQQILDEYSEDEDEKMKVWALFNSTERSTIKALLSDD